MRFPSIKDVARHLSQLNKSVVTEDNDGVDVRLQVYDDGLWFVRWGDSSYDLDHRGLWGASSIPGDNKRFKSRDIAKELLSQVKDDYYSSKE